MPFDFQVPLGPCGGGRDAPHPDLVESLLHTRFSAAAWAWTHSKKLSIGGFACKECTSDTSNTTEGRALHHGEGRFFLHSPSDLLARRWNSPVSTCAAALCSTRHLLYMILVLCIVPGASVLYSPHSITSMRCMTCCILHDILLISYAALYYITYSVVLHSSIV